MGGERVNGMIVAVTDGDTVRVDLGGRVTRVRLIGIDAPESKDPNSPVECFGPEASAIAARLMPPGTAVTVVTDPTQDRIDRYGRLLAYVLRRGGRVPLNVTLVRRGAAVVYVYRPSRPPQLVDQLVAAENAARSADVGLWGTCR